MNLANLLACSFRSADNLSFMDKGPLYEMRLTLPAVFSIFRYFDQMKKHRHAFFLQIGSMARDFPASKYLDFPVMQSGRLVKRLQQSLLQFWSVCSLYLIGISKQIAF